jgi:2',3'-cyclic-nucleotide 2'-phosphodiesterase (5'-nucleotidase family)
MTVISTEKRSRASGRVTLIQQNDIHGQLEQHPELFREGGREVYRETGGLARAATVIAAVRGATGAALLADCGDALHGSGPAMRSQGEAIVPALNALGVTAMTPGNWEYGFGPAVLWQRAAEMEFPLLACNLQNAEDGEHVLPPYAVQEVGGLRVGLVGITSPIIPEMSPDYARNLRFPDVRAHLPNCIHKLRTDEEVDLVVALSHLGFPQDVALAGEVDGLDVILSGHTHNRMAAPVRAGHTLIMQSGFSGSFLGQLDLELRDGVIVDTRHRLVALDASIAPDPRIQRLVDAQLAPYRAEMAEVLGHTQCGLHRMALVETSMDNLITDAYLEMTGADVALSHGWRFAPPVAPGPITQGDIWAMVPTNPEVATLPLTGGDLLHLIEENLHHVLAPNPFQQAGGYFVRVSGLSAVVRPYQARGMRVAHLEIGGVAVERDRTYTVAEAGIRELRNAGRSPTGMRAHDALRGYLAAQRIVNPEITHHKFVLQ